MLTLIHKDINTLQFQDVTMKRPPAIPYNVILHDKIYAAGYADGVVMIVYRNSEGKADNKINYFRLVDTKTIDHIVKGDRDWVGSFLENVINGLYPCYVEDWN